MYRAAYRSSSGALTVFAASGLHTHVVTGRSQVWVWTGFALRLDYSRSPHAYANQRLQIRLELLMMSGMPVETCWAFTERWNNKFCYKVASCWLFLRNLFSVQDPKDCISGTVKGKGKAIPLQAWTGPEGSRRLRLPDFKTIGTWSW